nr:serine/arginine-rich splicing factor 4-like [Leptinotarsa decemlineata]
MTKCPPKHCKPTTSFFYKVLNSIKILQSKEEYCNGVSLDEIEKFMEKTYCLTGDIRSQLENSISVADQSRLVTKKKKYYSLVSPAANLHLIPEPCVKAKLEEIQRSFNSVQCVAKNVLRKSRRIQFSQNKCSSCCEYSSRRANKRKHDSEPKNTRKSRSRSRSSTRKKESRSRTPCRSRSRSPSRSVSPKSRSRSKSPTGSKGDSNSNKRKKENCECISNSDRSTSPFRMPSKSCLKTSSDKSLNGVKKEVVFKGEGNSKSPCETDSSDN